MALIHNHHDSVMRVSYLDDNIQYVADMPIDRASCDVMLRAMKRMVLVMSAYYYDAADGIWEPLTGGVIPIDLGRRPPFSLAAPWNAYRVEPLED